jgi:hypothetical protein
MMSLDSQSGVSVAALGVTLIVVAFATTNRHRQKSRDPLRRVFRAGELRKLDARLDQIAADERSRLARDVVLYVAGDVGHVVAISDRPRHGIALGLSDGRLMMLSNVTRVTHSLLRHRVGKDKLRPARIERDGYFYRLLLSGESGTDMTIHTPMVSITH